MRSDDQIGEAITIDIPGRGHRIAGKVSAILPMDDKATRAGSDGGKVNRRTPAGCLAKHHIAVAGTELRIARREAPVRSNDEIREAITIDIPGRGHRPAGSVTGILPMDDKATRTGGDSGKVNRRTPAGCLAKHHIAVAGTVFRIARRVAVGRPDDQIGEAITIDIPGRGHRIAGKVSAILPMDDKATRAGSDGGKVNRRTPAGCLAKHHIAFASVDFRIARRVAEAGPNDQIGKAITIDIPGRGYGKAGSVIDILPMDDKATRAGGDGGEVNWCDGSRHGRAPVGQERRG